MKNVIKSFVIVAAAALTVISCSKGIEELTPGKTHHVKIHVSYTDTKTVINEGVSSASFKWSSDDASRFHLFENSTEGTAITLTSTDAYASMTLGADFATVSAAEYTYSAYLAKNTTPSGAPKIPTAQISTATSYDPDSDILIAEEQTYATTKNELNMRFGRPVVINKMTLKGLATGETVSQVVVSADKYITGYYTIASNSWAGQSSELTISTDQTVPLSGEVTVYFVTMPVSGATLTVTATTGNYIYSKTFTKTIDFVQNEVTVFGVSSLTETSKANYTGTYVITNAAGNKMANVWAGGNNLPAVDVTLEGGVIYYDPDAVTLSDSQVTLTKITDSESEYYGMYTIVQNSKYLYAAGNDKNYLKAQAGTDANAYWEVSCTSGDWSIVASKSTNRNVMQNNGDLFACYASASQTAVALYETAANVKPTPVIAANNINIGSGSVASTNTGATFNSNTSTVAAAAYDNAGLTVPSTWLAVSVEGTTVSYSASANTGASRIGYIKITATNSDSRSVVKTITVTQAAASPSEVEVLNEVFDDSQTTDSNTAITNETFSNFSGATSKAFKSQYGGIKFGNSSSSGYITSKSLDLSSSFTVKLNVLKYGSDTGKVRVTVGEVTKEITPTDTDTQYTLDFDAATSTSTVKIGTSAKRAYIDNVIIIRHD